MPINSMAGGALSASVVTRAPLNRLSLRFPFSPRERGEGRGEGPGEPRRRLQTARARGRLELQVFADSGQSLAPLTPTLSPQAGRGGQRPSHRALVVGHVV